MGRQFDSDTDLKNALVVQWIRTLDYGSRNKRSSRFESTNG